MSGDRLVFTKESNLQAIANAIREKKGVSETFTPDEMAGEIAQISTGMSIDVRVYPSESEEWQRPNGWPDLDSIEIDYENDEEVSYVTFDNTKTVIQTDYCWAGFYAVFSAKGCYALLERGTVSNGVFTAVSSSQSSASANNSSPIYFSDFYGEDQNPYPVYRITCVGGHFKCLDFGQISSTTSGLSEHIKPIRTGALERRGNLPWITSIGSSSSSISGASFTYGTLHLQRDSQRIAKNSVLTSMLYAWSGCHSLQSIDFTGWNTANWNLTNLQGTWADCWSLRKLNLSGWNTANWNVNNFSVAWQNCHRLKELNISGWDVSNWSVTTLYSTWINCFSLEKLDLSSWDVSGWSVTNLGNTWQNCNSLRLLDVSTWDTENWQVTNLSCTWQNCFSLKELDVSKWNTENWSVTLMTLTWNSCRSLQSLDLSGWDVSGWRPTSLQSTWSYCYSLRNLDVSGWDTSEWVVDTMYMIFDYDYSLQSLDLSDWDTTKWTMSATTARNYIFRFCDSLRTILVPDLKGSFSLSNSPLITYSGILAEIAELPTVNYSCTLSLNFNTYNNLTSADIAVATAKGWTVSA